MMKITYLSGLAFISSALGQIAFPIHPNGVTSKCLEVRGDVQANGTPVQIFDCNSTPAQRWLILENVGNIAVTVQLENTNFCLDAGSAPTNGTLMKIWTCFDNLPAQDWFFTFDNRIALFNQGLCLDLPNGDLTNTKQVQVWKCTDGDTNQVWNLGLPFPERR